MKSLLTRIVVFLLCIYMPLKVCATWDCVTVEVEGIKYSISYRSDPYGNYVGGAIVSVTANDYSGCVAIAETITVNVLPSNGHYDNSMGYVCEYPDFTLPVTNIERGAFANCANLISVTIPASIKDIGGPLADGSYKNVNVNPFAGCTGLQSITIDDSNPYFYSLDNCVGIVRKSDNTLIVGGSSTVIPSTVTSIGDYAFSYLNNITSMPLHDNIFNIGAYAFSGCSNLSSITIPASVNNIGNYAFKDCFELSSLSIPEGIKEMSFGVFEGCSKLTTVTLPESLNTISIGAGFSCEMLSELYCNSTTPPMISDYTWFNFDRMVIEPNPEVVDFMARTTVHVHDYASEAYLNDDVWSKFKEITYDRVTDFNLLYLVDNLEYRNIKYIIDDIIIPIDNPTKEGYTFSGWSEIPTKMPGKDVKVYGTFSRNDIKENAVIYWALNEKAVVLGNDNASGEVNITENVTFNEKVLPVTDILENSFKNNSNITSVTIPNGIITIGNYAFSGCSKLATIDMPATITSIGERAFAGIDKLTDVTIRAEEIPATDRTAFENSYIEDYVTLHVPGSAIKKYKETAPWKNFKEIVVIPGTEVIEKYKLIYMVDGEEYKIVEINEGEAVTPEEVPTKEGYTFSGWSDIPETMPGEDVTVSGTFTINKYKLVYMVDGQEYKTYDVEYKSAIDAEAAPTKEGYTFSGWSEIPEAMPAKDVTVTGSFTINKYTITYYVDGEVYKTYEIEYGSEISQEADPEKEGYDFSGWSWTPSKMPAEDVTVTGSFTKVSYDVDGAKFEINDDGMTLTKADGASGDVVLDATVTINGKAYRITVIGEGAFEGNKDITSLTVADGIYTIMPNAFNGCVNLMKLILGKDVRYIGGKAFANIGSASARHRAASEPLVIECEAEYVPDADSDAFYGVDTKSAILKVNDELVNFYKTTSPWSSFSNIYGLSDTSAINGVFVSEEGAAIFSIDGRKFDTPQKGLNIIHTSKGVKKLYRK